jgi:hypothetical protein
VTRGVVFGAEMSGFWARRWQNRKGDQRMVQKWILIDKLPDGLFKVIGEITVAAGQLEYVLMLSYKRASGKGMAVGMHKAEELLTVKNLLKELKKDFKQQIPDAAANRELGEIFDTVWKVYQKRHTVVHAVFVETADGKLARFYSDKPNVRVKAIDYGVEMKKLTALRDDTR